MGASMEGTGVTNISNVFACGMGANVCIHGTPAGAVALVATG